MSGVIKSLLKLTKNYPIVRGMISYGIVWPAGSYSQQKIEGKEIIDWKRCMRYFCYGSMLQAPFLYLWMRSLSILIPSNSIKASFSKALIEQIVYEPISLCVFFTIMTLSEGKTMEDAKHEISVKFWPTFLVSSCFWPAFQTLNFAYVPERNRVLTVSLASFSWMTFLATVKHMKYKKIQQKSENKSSKP